MLFVASIGLICIYAGYQLFCGVPSGWVHRALILNIVPGALLGLAGMGILTAEFRMTISHKPVVERRRDPKNTAGLPVAPLRPERRRAQLRSVPDGWRIRNQQVEAVEVRRRYSRDRSWMRLP